MPIVVQAVSNDAFNAWVAQQPKVDNESAAPEPMVATHMTRQELMALGKAKYNDVCAACHKANGKGIPPMFPALKGSSVAVGKPISRHILMILNGVPGTAMQPYKDILTDTEMAAIATYERNAWENNTGDVVQPSDVARVRRREIQQPKMVQKVHVGGFQ